MENLLKKSHKGSNECPTCGARQIEVDPGIFEWAPSTYRYSQADVPCNCELQRVLFRHYLLARIPEEYMRLSVDADYFGDPEALNATNEYLRNWGNNKIHGIGLGFYSQTQGTGKTFLATHVARSLIRQGESVYYVNFLSIIRTYQMEDGDRKDEEERLRDSTILVIDEIVGSTSEAQRDLFAGKLEELVRHRSNYNRVTIFTTNFHPERLDEEYPRTFSLLQAKQNHITVHGTDVRREGVWDINKELAENGEIRPIS